MALTQIMTILGLLNANNRENSDVTIQTARLINCEITSQVTNNLDETNKDLHSHNVEVISSTMAAKNLPSIQNTLGKHEKDLVQTWI